MADTTESQQPQDTQNNEAPANVPSTDLEKLLEKAAQSAADRVRTELHQKIKAKDEELEQLRMEKMTAKERADHETKKLKDELETKARMLNRQAMELLATRELEAAGLDQSFIESVIGSDEDATKGKIVTLKKTFDAALGKAVESQMKAQGRDPNKGRSGSGETSELSGMTPADILKKARDDPKWMSAHKQEVNELMASGKLKK
jgi:hypothetical protein